jgi:predicted O-methyltransferase YrrM
MPEKFTAMTPELHAYVVEHGARRDELLGRLAAETEALGGISIMQIAPEQGALMTLLVRAIEARRAIELGTFTGYGAICIARGLPAGGRLLTCELSEEYAGIARRYFTEAGLEERIELAMGPAMDTLRDLPREEAFDFAFIDADKPPYPEYYEELLPRMNTGGLVMVDNVLHGGGVVNPGEDDSESGRAIRELNDRIAADERVDVAMLGIADGVTLARKR